MEQDTYIYSHILGGVYGQALGDAWAMPAYFRPDQTWAYHNHHWIDKLIPAPPDHPIHAGFQAGQVTDDTQQAMALAQTIITDGQITVEGAAQAIVDWYDQIDGDRSSSIGPSTRRAVAALKAGTDPKQSGLYGDTNGGAMRVSPIGLIHPGNPEAAVEDAIIACTPTHFTDVAVSGACAVAAVAQALTPHTTLQVIIEVAIQAAEIGRQQGVPWRGASVARKIDYAVHLATDVKLSELDRVQNLYDLVGSTLSPADAVLCAFGVLAMANGNPVETAIFASALSGDANTVGAMACAIAGAWHGSEVFPVEHIEILRQANPEYNFEETAKGLYQIAHTNYLASSQSDENLFDPPPLTSS
jgi:ADP-ribosylglycohydrolase